MLPLLLVCVVISMVLGGFWYSPAAFGTMWAKESGVSPSDASKMKQEWAKAMLAQLVSTVVLVTVLHWMVRAIGVGSWMSGLKMGLLIWLGFIATVGLSRVIFENKSVRWLLINTGYSLVQLSILGALMGAWRV